MCYRYLTENNKAVKLTPIRNNEWYHTEYLSKDGEVIDENNTPVHFYNGVHPYIPTEAYNSFDDLKRSHPNIYNADISADSVNLTGWDKDIPILLKSFEKNGIIKVPTKEIMELGIRAANRMYPEKNIRFVTEWPILG